MILGLLKEALLQHASIWKQSDSELAVSRAASPKHEICLMALCMKDALIWGTVSLVQHTADLLRDEPPQVLHETEVAWNFFVHSVSLDNSLRYCLLLWSSMQADSCPVLCNPGIAFWKSLFPSYLEESGEGAKHSSNAFREVPKWFCFSIPNGKQKARNHMTDV